jgi:hypothetical protein
MRLTIQTGELLLDLLSYNPLPNLSIYLTPNLLETSRTP